MIDRTRMLRVCARLASPFLGMAESQIYRSVEDQNETSHFPVFLLGAPRTGSTILYQMLTEELQCLYIDNLVYAFSDRLPFGFWLSQKLYGNSGHGSFESTYGRTGSLHSPSECGAFWFRWFPRSHDFVEAADIDSVSIDQLRQNLHTVMNHYNQSIVIKNLNAGQRLRVLKPALPNTKFVFIRRSPFFTIQSLLKARMSQKMPDDRWWSVRPKNHLELAKLPLIEKLTGQVFHLERQIVEDTQSLSAKQVREISYSNYSQEFESLLNFLDLPRRNKLDIGSFQFSNKVTVDDKTRNQILSAMDRYDWSELGYDR